MHFSLLHFLLKGRANLFTIIILLKILFMRSIIFPDTTDLKILILEFASVVIIFGLLALIKPRSTGVFWAVDFLLSTYFMTSVMYHSYFGQMLNYAALLQVAVIKDLGFSILTLFSPAYCIFYFDFFFILIRQNLQNKINLAYQDKARIANHQKTVFVATFLALVLTLLNILSYPAKDNRMAMTRDVGTLNAQGYEIYKSLRNKENSFLPVSEFSQTAINQLKLIKPILWPKYFGAASGKNVILVQLESTENFLVGLAVNNQEITPNLNRLIKESMYFPHFYSQIGQGNTSDAEFITNTSLYPREKGGIATDFIGINYPSLPRLLKKEGYTSVTFHPNVVTFWNRDNLYPCLGFDKYYDREFYQDEDRLGPWGSSDEVLFKKALPVLIDFQQNEQRFYASFIALTNHHPFVLPDDRKRIILPSQLEGTLIGNYLTSVNYQDYAFGQFIEDLKANDLWNNSIFIVFGDHYGFTKAMDTQRQNVFSLLLGREHDEIDRLNVPLIIRVPGLNPQINDTLGGQVDILPTLTNLLGITLDKQVTFGQDIFNYDQNLLGFRFYNPDGTFITSNLFHLAGSDIGQDIDSHKIIRNRELFLKEELRIKSLMQLSDRYLESLDKNKKGITFEITEKK